MRSVGPLCLAISIAFNPTLLMLFSLFPILYLLYLTSPLFILLPCFASLPTPLLVSPLLLQTFPTIIISLFPWQATSHTLQCSPVDAGFHHPKTNLTRHGYRASFHSGGSTSGRRIS